MATQDGLLGLTIETQASTDQIISLDEGSSVEAVVNENQKYTRLIELVLSKYRRSRDQRQWDETRWLKCYQNFRGIYGPDVQFTDTEKSQAFPKITKQKVFAAFAQITEILFSGGKFPIGVESTPVPLGIAESVHFDPKSAEQMAKQQGGPSLSPTVARADIMTMVGNLREKLQPVKDQLKEGPGVTPTSYTFEPAKEAAKNMEKLIQDQLAESNAGKHLRSFVFDMCLFGTGISKGPLATSKEYPKWDENGKYSPDLQTIPDVEHVSIWDAYPDPDARNMEEAEYFIQRHKLSRTQLRQLKKRPYFREESIELAIKEGSHYITESWESSINDSGLQADIDRFEVFEYWGILDKDMAEEAEIEYPKEFKLKDQVQVNIWVCNNQLLRVVMNPFTPSRIPYHACPYELNPYSFFGVGVAENMDDSQMLMNGFMRLAVDNGVLSSNVVMEIDETNLVPGQTMEFYPGKIFRRQGGQPGTSINAINIPNITQEAMMMFDKARQLADESTGMPSYSHGISGVMGTGRTAAGMSMLMGAAKENIKSVVRNIDDYYLIRLGKDFFAFNMQFNFDKKYIGDLSIVARGTESLIRNEVRSQKLLQFLQISANPMDAAFVKRDYILRELAQSLDLEPDKVVNDPREAGIQAAMMAEMQKIMGIQPDQMMQGGNPAGAPSINDPTGTGGGNIAPGMAPPPGAQGNTGAGGGSPQAAQANQMKAQ